MRENYTLTRLFVTADLTEGAAVDLPRDQAHYLGNVLRKSVGDGVRVFNGRDGEWRAEITALGKRGGTLRGVEVLRAQSAVPDITLAFAPIRKHRTAFIIEKATELGVARLQPVITARTQFPKFNAEKAHAQAIEAAEQTERLDVPEILPPIKLLDWVGDFQAAVIFADEAGGALAADVVRRTPAPVTILIGPEGGFTEAEREALHAQDNVHPVTLGPRILRADTAALALLALWQSAQGDWG